MDSDHASAVAAAVAREGAPLAGRTGAGRAWVALCLALALHVIDEAATGFLAVYNPTVEALRARVSWFPMPVFTFDGWLGGLVLAVILLLLLTPAVARGAAWARGIAWGFSIFMIVNACGHIAGTIAGRTVASVTFPRPMPGFYSSPILLAASLYMLARLRSPNKSAASRPPNPA